MSLDLIFIASDADVAQSAERNGVDWVLVDLELLGKEARQGHLDTVISGHTIDDVKSVRSALTTSQLMVRTNPMHDGLAAEVESILEAGVDSLMLPYFKTDREVMDFVRMVDGRAKVCLLLETSQAVSNLEAILAQPGIDRVHIGINDLHLDMGLDFMFQLLSKGVIESLCREIEKTGIPYGFGGIARIGAGDLPAEMILAEHYRLGSSSVILSRAFCDTKVVQDIRDIDRLFGQEVPKVRSLWNELESRSDAFFDENTQAVEAAITKILDGRSRQ